MVNVDREGNALRPAILWLDDRRAEMRPVWSSGLELLLKMAGVYPALKHAYENAEWNWLVQQQPEIVAATYKYLTLSGYLQFKLCGQFRESVANMVGYLPFDYRTQRWYPAGRLLRKLFDVPLEKLPELHATGSVLGAIGPLAAEQTGIPTGLPLIAGAADKAAEVLGSGVVDDSGVACLSLGTTATVQTVMCRYQEIERHVPPYPSAVAGRYNSEIMIFKGFWMVSWFRDQFGHPEKTQAQSAQVSPEQLLDELIEEAPAGCLGLIVQPYWGAGVRVPEPGAKGAMVGFGDVHSRAFVYRAIVEGLGYALREGLQKTERRLGKRFPLLRLAGGGSQSDRVMQTMADITGRPVERPHTSEASILGTAINMAVALGHHAGYATAVQQMVRIGARCEPNPDQVALYDQLYRRVYLKLYKRLRPLYREIRDITGYPPI